MLFTFLYSCIHMPQMYNTPEGNGGARNHAGVMHNSPVGLSCSAFPLDPRRKPQHLVMAHEAAHSDLLQQLGVSYPQLIDYYSKAYTATLVGPTMTCRPLFTDIYTDIGSSWRFGFDHMELYYYLVCTLLPSISNIIDISHSDGEMAYFWQAERRTRWSIARTLFMVVGS